MKKLKLFLRINKTVLLGMIIGIILGYVHWYFWGCYWGTYPFSSECFVNCIYGMLMGGFSSSIFNYE